uniref:Phorbol-ester/DAG-type domain-containing protein n=1 Tax=Macrostomum lignano TaxID=282301 RepID=A0A1I8IF91_9PLAT
MGSFMSGDPNFNRETSDSQSMTKALSTLKTYLSQYSEMKRFRPAMLVFLHSLLARKEAKWYKALNFVVSPSCKAGRASGTASLFTCALNPPPKYSQFFDWLADDWKTAGLAPKQSKRAAFSVYSTFLNREGSLSLEAVARSLDPGLGLGRPALNEPIKTLSQLFAKRPMDSHIERIAAGFSSAQASLRPTLEALVASVSAEIQTKRRDGFVSDILPGVDGLRPDLSDERQQRFIEQCRGVMLAHVNYMIGTPFGGHLEAGCLASLLERFFRLRLPPELPPELPQFNFQRLRGSGGRSFGGLKEIERRGTHLLRPVELDRIRACSACGKLLCGPGPQAMRCKVGDCQVVSHRACMDLVKPISCSSAAGLLTRSHSNEGRDSSHACGPSAHPQPQAGGRAAPKAAARSSAADAAATEPASQASTAAAAGPPLPHPVASMPQLGADFGGDGGRSGHRGSLDSGQDAMVGDSRLLSPCDVVVEPGYIESTDLARRLAQLRPASGSDKDADRFREYQLALHEVIFSSKSHLRSLNLLELLFVQPWPQTNRQVLQQLGLHFVSECIALYRSLHDCIGGGDNLAEFQRTGRLERFGDRLLGWYSEGNNALNFQRLGLSFGFSKVTTRRKTASINEDDIILRLISLRREDPTFNRFFTRAEAHPAMNKRRFVDLYSVNMQQTMRMVTLLETAAKKAKKAREACEFADEDAENLEKCVAMAKAISDYCNSTGAKLKELSRQLVLSKSFSIFWERSLMDETRIIRFKDQVSHLHTCELHMTREVFMPGLEGYRLRLFVFSDFLLVISESDEARGVKYQLLKQLGPSVSVVDSQQQQQSAELANLIETNCPPVIPMDSVVHIFDTATESKRRLPGSRLVDAEFRIIVEQVMARGTGGANRVKPLMLEFRMSLEKPRLPFFPNETLRQASDFVECIRGLAPRLSQRQLDRHASLSGSALELTARAAGSSFLSLPGQQQHLPAAQLQADHRRVHSSAGINVPRPQTAVLRRPDTDESEGEAAGPEADSQQPSSPSAEAAAPLSAGLAGELQSRVEAAIREQQTLLPVALGINWCASPDALTVSCWGSEWGSD